VDRSEQRLPDEGEPRPAAGPTGARGRVPHASFATWEPKVENDDDQPIFTEPAASPREAPAPPSPSPSARRAASSEPLPVVIARDTSGAPISAEPKSEGPGAGRPPSSSFDEPGYAQIFVNVGRRDGARPGDLQRLLEASGLPALETARIRVRERNTFLSVKKELVERAVAALAGQVLGGRSLIAELARPREGG